MPDIYGTAMKTGCHMTPQQSGFTLVEMLVALAVGVIVFAGIGQVFISTKRTSVTQDEITLLQENSRYAAHLLGSELRHAGYLGCGSPGNLSVTSAGTFTDNFTVSVSGYEAAGTAPGAEYSLDSGSAGWEPGLPNELSDKGILAGSDIIVVRRAKDIGLEFAEQNENGFVITSPTAKTAQGCSETQDSYYGLCPGDMAIVSDCIKVRSFKINTLHESGGGGLQIYHNENWGGTSDLDIKNHFNKKQSRLFTGYTVSFFIRNNTSNIPSLYRLVSNHSPAVEELIEGVENMQILYGIDSDGDGAANQYLPAGNTIDFSQVISVRIALLLRSNRGKPNRVPPERTPGWDLLSTKITPTSDNLFRRVFSTTIQLRDEGN